MIPEGWVQCPRCEVRVKREELATHLRQKHGVNGSKTTRKDMKRAKIEFASRRLPEERDTMDASKDYFRFRDSGQFGSYPLNDGSDEE